MNQASVITNLIRSGWELGHMSAGFVNLYKRDRTRNLICPDYFDVTVFANGRTAEGEYKKYPRGWGLGSKETVKRQSSRNNSEQSQKPSQQN